MKIKFRAWNECEKIMEYDIQDEYDGDLTCFGCYLDNKFWDVMQYTGLKDKNGRGIYEGDILKAPIYLWSCKNAGNDYYIVKQSEENINMYLEYNFYRRGCWQKNKLKLYNIEDLEVVGNVWENKEIVSR